MASYGSISSDKKIYNSNSLVIPKPSSLAAGDLMVAVCYFAHYGAAFTPPSGWETVSQNDISSQQLDIFLRVATSGDASATDFTFTPESGGNAGDDSMIGVIIRVTGTFNGLGNVNCSVAAGDGDTSLIFSGITPISSDALLIMGAGADNTATITFSGYAITNNNPTWTERFEDTISSTNDASMGIATATATSASSTGNVSITLSNSSTSGGFILSIDDTTNATFNPSVIVLTTSIPTPTVTGSATFSPSVISLTTSIPTPSITAPTPDWTNPNKSATSTFVNPDKS